MTTLAEVIIKGLSTDIPSAGIPGRLYFTTDTNDVFYDDGTAWDNVTPSGGGSGVSSLNSLTGALTLTAGSNVTITPSGSSIEIASSGGGGGGSYQPSSLPLPPASSDFTIVNNETLTLSTVGSVLVATIGNFGSNAWQFMEQSNAYSAPYSIAMAFSAANGALQSNTTLAGLYLTDGTKLVGLECVMFADGSGGTGLRIEHMTNSSTDSSTVYGPVFFGSSSQNNTSPPTQGIAYFRWRNDGTNLYADVSPDGVIWNNIHSEAVGSFITPTAYGWGGFANGSEVDNVKITLSGWLATNSASL